MVYSPRTRKMQSTGTARRTGIHASRQQNTLVLKILIAVISCLILWDIAGPYGLWARNRMLKKREALYASNMQMAIKNTQLEEEIRRIQTDHQYQALMVRSKLGWVRDNEILFRFVGEDKTKP